jgi:leader peptidase (prepilin peptidase)/N-methyltransferase
MIGAISLGTAVFGAVIGSFLNVLIYRLPLGRSLAFPASACPGCGHRIAAWDNIPVLSWLALNGRCRNCRMPISPRYPLVELGTAVFFGFVAWKFLVGPLAIMGHSPVQTLVAASALVTLVAFLYLAAVSVTLALIDVDTQRLPNRIVLPSYIVGAVLLTAAGILSDDYPALVRAGIGLGGMFSAYFLMAWLYQGGMGFGDVKLAGVLGLFLGWLGWGALAVGMFAAFLFGGLFALALLTRRRANRRSQIPFGPWMLAGAWFGIFLGDVVAGGYLRLFGLT